MKPLEILLRDARVAWRGLVGAPIPTTAAVASIAIGIAATTAVFSVVDAALLRPPPFPDPQQLMMLYITRQHPGEAAGLELWSWPRAKALREHATSFRQIATFSTSVLAITSADAEPEPLTADLVSYAYWPLLRISPALGRAFTPDADAAVGASPEIVLGYDVWQRRFGGEISVLGRMVGVNGVQLRVVGIAPRGFEGLSGRAQAWIPATMAPLLSYRDYLVTNQSFISVVGHLRDNVSPERARTELALVSSEVQRIAPNTSSIVGTRFGIDMVPLATARIDPGTRRPMVYLLGAAACLLLLACANVAGLLLGRAVSRRREIAIRVATGASRARIVHQLLVEAALIAAAGGTLGVLVAVPAAGQILLPAAASRSRNFYGALGEFATPQVDLRVLSFCVALCALTTIAFGLFPALRATRVDLARDLKEGTPTASAPRAGARQWLVAVETGLAVILLFCGGLLLTSWHRMAATPVGFDRSNVLSFLVRPSEAVYPAPKAPALIQRVLGEISAVPGVEAATVDGCFPVGTGCANSTLFVMGRPVADPNAAPSVLRHYVGPDHFRVLKIPLVRGRVFDARDRAGAPHVAVINDLAAKRFWPNEDPIGKRVWFSSTVYDSPDSSAEIVGVVEDVAYQQIDQRPFQPDFYTPYMQFTYATRMVMVRTRGDPLALVADLRRAVRRADPNLALFEAKTLGDRIDDSWARLVYQTRLLAAFALAALLLAGTGIFAVIAHVIGDRRREIGVRVALGATPAQIIALAGNRGARPALTGLGVGLAASMLVGRALAASIYGVRASEPLVAIPVTIVMVAVILVAAYLAARRALSIEPAEAFR